MELSEINLQITDLVYKLDEETKETRTHMGVMFDSGVENVKIMFEDAKMKIMATTDSTLTALTEMYENHKNKE